MLYLSWAIWELDRSRWKAAITLNLPDLKSSLLQAPLIVSNEAHCLLSLKPNDLSRAKFQLEIGFSGSWFWVYFFLCTLYVPRSGPSWLQMVLVCNEKGSDAAPAPRGGFSNGTNYVLSTVYTRFDFGLFAQLFVYF